MPKPINPEVVVKLTGEDGNAFFIIGKVRKALKEQVGNGAAYSFSQEAMKGDYDHVLRTCMKHVTVE